MKSNIIKTTFLALCATFLLSHHMAYACITPNIIIKFNDTKEFFKNLSRYIELRSGQFLIIETPDEGAKTAWTAFVDYASSINAGTPKKPKLQIIFFDKSEKITQDPNAVRFIAISSTPENYEADAIIGFLHQSQENSEILDTLVTRVKIIQSKSDSHFAPTPKCI